MASSATPRQLSYLKQLASETGTTFTYPATVAQASAEIKRMKPFASRGTSFAELEVKHHNAPKLERTVRDTAQVLRSEITGYGSSARWR
jgi:hypothetical protein